MPSATTSRVIQLADRGIDLQQIAAIIGITPAEAYEAMQGVDLADPTSGSSTDLQGRPIIPSASCGLAATLGVSATTQIPSLGSGSYGALGAPSATLNIGPHTVAAGAQIVRVLIGRPASITEIYVGLIVTNVAGTQRLVIEQELGAATEAEEAETQILASGWEVAKQTGEDLSFSEEAEGVVSAAGGTFFAWANFILSNR